VLVEAKLLRIVTKGGGSKSSRYVARERLDVYLGKRVVCFIVVDYIPATIRQTIRDIESGIQSDHWHDDVFASCEVYPGDGFAWDAATQSLKAEVPVRDALSELSQAKQRLVDK
jgi:hypothetical protein